MVGFVVAGLLVAATPGRAEDRQLRPFFGATFAGDTTLVDNEHAVGKAHATYGINAAWLGNIVGVDVDAATTPEFFRSDGHLVQTSNVSTVVGDVVVAAPRRLSEYSLRLYFVAGGGIMRVAKADSFGLFNVSDVLPAMDVGVGAVGFLTRFVGVDWEVRRFQSLGGPTQSPGVIAGSERLSFWRASMALVLRY